MDRIDLFPSDLVESLAQATTADEQLAILQSTFHVQVMEPDQGFDPEALYFVIGSTSSSLIQTHSPAIVDGHLHFRSCMHDTPMKPLSLDRLQAAIERQCVYRVWKKPVDPAERDQILDVGSLSQLIDAAQRSGLVPGIATIIQVRDCEFRLGRYQQALQLIESQFQAFQGRAAQRTQQLAREDLDIASGRIKMSGRELQIKRQRDRQQTQAVDRARTRFSRVLEGLRMLVKHGL
jgi:phospholipase/lecithinase/hemolysin